MSTLLCSLSLLRYSLLFSASWVSLCSHINIPDKFYSPHFSLSHYPSKKIIPPKKAFSFFPSYPSQQGPYLAGCSLDFFDLLFFSLLFPLLLGFPSCVQGWILIYHCACQKSFFETSILFLGSGILLKINFCFVFICSSGVWLVLLVFWTEELLVLVCGSLKRWSFLWFYDKFTLNFSGLKHK